MKEELYKNDAPKNSTMVGNMEEMKELGKQMESLRTSKELKEDNKIPDPIQYKEKSRVK